MSLNRLLLTTGIVILSLIFTACGNNGSPDLILHNGTIITMDENRPEVGAVAVLGDRIVAVGNAENILAMAGNATTVIDFEGRFVSPGFIEGHAHFTGVGVLRMQLDLLGIESWQEIVAMVEQAVAEAEDGDLILGRGWHQNDWTIEPERMVGDLPHHEQLSAVSPNNPVILTHASGHMRFANAYAMEMAGVDNDTENPRGGEIVRDETGAAAGAFRQRASDLLQSVGRSWSPDLAQVMRNANEESLRYGITTFGDAGTSVSLIEQMIEVHQSNPLSARLHLMVRSSNENLRDGLPRIAGKIENDPYFTVSGIKKAIDGALGTHGAWMVDPYTDRPETSGFNITPLEEIYEAGELSLEHNIQMAVHAIGDRGNREVMDLYEAIWEAHDVDGTALRWRIEHAQNLHPDDIPRLSKLGLIASMQGVHATSDGPWVPQRIGEERSRQSAYVWRSLLDEGTIIINGTDAPVERLDPLPSFYGSVTREMRNGEQFFPEQSMSRVEALRSFTIDGAYGIFREHDLGSIEVGKLADFTIFDRNLLTVSDDELRDAKVTHTIVGGRVVYTSEDE